MFLFSLSFCFNLRVLGYMKSNSFNSDLCVWPTPGLRFSIYSRARPIALSSGSTVRDAWMRCVLVCKAVRRVFSRPCCWTKASALPLQMCRALCGPFGCGLRDRNVPRPIFLGFLARRLLCACRGTIIPAKARKGVNTADVSMQGATGVKRKG